MDGSRIDRMARSLAATMTRRHALRGATTSVVTGLLAHSGGADVAAACIKAGQRGCDGPRNRTCCQGAACQGGSQRKEGKCKCKPGLRKCAGTCANTKTDETHCGRCNSKCRGGSACKNGVCTSRLGCTVAKDVCVVGQPAGFCPGRDDCACVVGVNGAPYCTDESEGFCSTCTKNADCPAGLVCVDVQGCGCPGGGQGTGNACINPTCQGVG